MTILPQLERDLHKAAEERLGIEEVRRRRPRLGRVLVAFGVVVALAIAGLGIALVGGHRAAPASPAAATPPALHRLLSRYGVFRRPQTAADRSWRLVWTAPGDASLELIPRLTRLAATLPDRERVFLTVGRVIGPQLQIPLGSYLVRAWVLSRDRTRTVIGQAKLYFASGATLLATSRAVQFSPFPAPQPHSTIWTAIVPDGIKVIDWAFPGRAILSSVGGNVAAARGSAASSAVPQRVSWEDGHGRIVKTYTRTPAPLRILYGNGVGGARFGESSSKVIALLTAQLGSPHRVVGGGCGVVNPVTWGRLAAFFKHGRFVGYSYGTQGPPPLYPPILATARGLRLGGTVAQARRLYGPAFQTSEAQGGSWLVTTEAGRVDGFLASQTGRVGPQTRIASIQAGPFICAALSP